jgi:predicted transglutaminase-like cysteine proteinase
MTAAAHGHFPRHFTIRRMPGWLGHLVTYLLGLGLAIAVLAAVSSARAETTYPSLFGYQEVRSENLSAFKKWNGALARYFREREIKEGSCESSFFNRCHLQDWQKLLADLQGKDRMSQLNAVNHYMNRASYIVDPINYRMPDYWATPRQFFDKDGDCEDYAIAKYLSMRSLGLPASAMRIVVLQDENLRIAHAVLAVYLDGKAWILDNQIRQVVAADRIRHYRPFYSINEEYWWIHRGKKAAS